MAIVFSRAYAPLKIMRDGQKVGEIIRYERGGYGLFLSGIYWTASGDPTRRGGASGRGFKRLKDAKRVAGAALLEPVSRRDSST